MKTVATPAAKRRPISTTATRSPRATATPSTGLSGTRTTGTSGQVSSRTGETRIAGLPLVTVLAALLILTGASGLIYQVVWFRVLGLVFGVTVHATTVVLAAFMAGLALGSFLAARIVDRLRYPLRTYGVMEVCIGLSGFVSLYAFEGLQPLYRGLAPALEGSPALLHAVRFALAFAIMLVPTTLMGATLPIVVRSSVLGARALSRNVSLLYAFNTLGAILGAYSAGFYLIGLFGTGGSVSIAAGLNVIVGLLCFLIGARRQALPATASPDEVRVDGEAHAVPASGSAAGVAELPLAPGVARAVLLTYAVSGGVALAYEVVWTRVLSLVFPATVYAFALMLCAILAGIAAGSWAMEAIVARRANWLFVYASFEAAMGVLGIFSVTILARTYGIEAALRRLLGTERLLHEDLWFMILFAFLTVFPAAFIMGTTFPVAAKLYAQGHGAVGNRVGTIYGANVLGAIAGSLISGLVLIPALGGQRTAWFLGAVNVALALVILTLPAAGRVQLRFGLAGVSAVAAIVAAALTPDMYQRLFGSHPKGETVAWYQEGDDATIRVSRTTVNSLILYVNSQGQASDVGSGLRFHRAVGHLPALLHPNAQNVLVVGLGGGATAGAVATHSKLDVTIAELHAGVVEGAKLFSHANYGVLDRPNVRVTVADGRNHLLVTNQRYDIIQGDIIPPGNAGAANLYSADYYRLARGALKPGGIMVQWVDSELPEYHWQLLLRTFLSVFPNATLWGKNGSIIVGTADPLRLDRAALEATYRGIADVGALRELEMSTPDELLAQFVAGPDELRRYVGEGQIITDRHPSIEYTRTLPSGGRAVLERFSHDARQVLR